jgi:hypothetical protein
MCGNESCLTLISWILYSSASRNICILGNLALDTMCFLIKRAFLLESNVGWEGKDDLTVNCKIIMTGICCCMEL